MFFKNLIIFRITEGWKPTAVELSETLSKGVFQPCGAADRESSGWVPVCENGALAHGVNGQLLIALRTETKLLPGSVVRRAAAAKAKLLEQQQGYRPGRKQMREITEQMEQEMLPRAFTNERNTFVWIDPVNRWMVIDGASSARADDVIEKLKLTLGELPLSVVRTQLAPAMAMTTWLASGEAPAAFSIDRDCELRSMEEERATVRYARHTLEGDEVRGHVEGGKKATRLAMTWNDRISFVLTEQLQIKRLAFLDLLKEQVEQDAKNADDLFDAEFVLMAGELSKLIAGLIAALGGEAEV